MRSVSTLCDNILIIACLVLFVCAVEKHIRLFLCFALPAMRACALAKTVGARQVRRSCGGDQVALPLPLSLPLPFCHFVTGA